MERKIGQTGRRKSDGGSMMILRGLRSRNNSQPTGSWERLENEGSNPADQNRG